MSARNDILDGSVGRLTALLDRSESLAAGQTNCQTLRVDRLEQLLQTSWIEGGSVHFVLSGGRCIDEIRDGEGTSIRTDVPSLSPVPFSCWPTLTTSVRYLVSATASLSLL
jgi:hypothetical protein